MPTVIIFPGRRRPRRREVVRITAAYQIEGVAPPHAGRLMFYVDLLRADGTELDLWEGISRDGALAAAREWESVGVPIIDETAPCPLFGPDAESAPPASSSNGDTRLRCYGAAGLRLLPDSTERDSR